MRDYTAELDAEGRLPLRGDALAARYRVRHRADGVIELQPEGDGSTSARMLRTVERSVEALGRGEASAPVDLDETFPGLGADGEPGTSVRVPTVAELAAEIERLRIHDRGAPGEPPRRARAGDAGAVRGRLRRRAGGARGVASGVSALRDGRRQHRGWGSVRWGSLMRVTSCWYFGPRADDL